MYLYEERDRDLFRRNCMQQERSLGKKSKKEEEDLTAINIGR